MNAKAIKTVRKVERPRPLKVSSTNNAKNQTVSGIDPNIAKKPLSDFLEDFEAVYVNLNNCNYDENTAAEITKVCEVLKARGQEFEAMKSLMDHYFVTFRNASREDRLDMVSRLQLLHIIELRAMGWKESDNISNFYKNKISELQGTEKPQVLSSVAQSYSSMLPSPTQPQVTTVSVPLAPGEILRSSGKFAKPTKIAGKNYYKDEVVIRNSDSGKVMGIKGRRVHMIEELSDTIISFQRVSPGARDRLVQITGPNEEAISHAKTLVEDTIRRNASPIREKPETSSSIEIEEQSRVMPVMNLDDQEFPRKQLSHSFSMGDASLGEYSYEISIGQDVIRLSGTNLDLLKVAKYGLMKLFAEQSEDKELQQIPPPIAQSDIVNFENINFGLPKNPLQRSSSWMGSVDSNASVSTLDTSSEEEINRNGGQKQAPNEDLPIDQCDVSAISNSHEDDIPPPIPPPEPRKLVYSRDTLMEYSKSPLCNYQPKLSEDVLSSFPHFKVSETS